jgi:hypothetical protein
MRPIYGPALYVDARTAFLFRCQGAELWAVTLDGSGANLPKQACPGGWCLHQEFPLGVQEPVPVITVSAEPILQGLLADGFYLWRPFGR